MFFQNPLQYILALSCAASLTAVVSAQEMLTPGIITSTFPTSPMPSSSSMASQFSTALSSPSPTPTTTGATATATTTGTKTTSRSSTRTHTAAKATGSKSAARKLEYGSWAGPVVLGAVGWLGVVI
ncbi:hypothetical protein WAI453_008415 [Rhynchosporium graminicola]|uniref:Uncharacterized protein n=1 Tax=Rhynchosporium graminicola TaxID=2792576 RepID=A0A1E1KLX0_9HELO|nr:uncharacterized protein RCO7_00410 [Rhynchosporium commune]